MVLELRIQGLRLKDKGLSSGFRVEGLGMIFWGQGFKKLV